VRHAVSRRKRRNGKKKQKTHFFRSSFFRVRSVLAAPRAASCALARPYAHARTKHSRSTARPFVQTTRNKTKNEKTIFASTVEPAEGQRRGRDKQDCAKRRENTDKEEEEKGNDQT